MTIRVFVVDGAVGMRKEVCRAVHLVPGLEVVGSAGEAPPALEKVRMYGPDVVIADPHVRTAEGASFVVELRAEFPHLPIVVFAASAGGEAIPAPVTALGGTKFVAVSPDLSIAQVRRVILNELVPTVLALAPAPVTELPLTPVPRSPRSPLQCLVIGASTGGPTALAELMALLRPSMSYPVLVVQHMPRTATRLLAARLSSCCGVRAKEGVGGAVPKPGDVWIAPGGHHMRVRRDGALVRLDLEQGAAIHGCRPAVDPLFSSAAEVWGDGVLGVVLTGMGQDGLVGAGRLRDAGARILVQDRASSVVWGMPGHIADAGLADGAHPIPVLAAEIRRRFEERAATAQPLVRAFGRAS